jgi:type II secretory pathway pseudopilin PulG
MKIFSDRQPSRNDVAKKGSATVPVALAGVSPASRTGVGAIFSHRLPNKNVSGETPKTAAETAALPHSTASFRLSGFTLVEVLAIIAVMALMASMLLPMLARPRSKSLRISCLNNLKEVGIAYRLWPGDQGDLNPAQQMATHGGWNDFLTNGNAGPKCWMNYATMSNDLGQSPRLLICPSDERQAAQNFAQLANTNISYFVGVGACDVYPQSILGGDRNLGLGTKPDPDYGYSPKDGRGNDVVVPVHGAVLWSLKMHSAGNAAGAGNILIGDGSSQPVSSSTLTNTWLPNAVDAGNFPSGYIPAVPSIRLVFP